MSYVIDRRLNGKNKSTVNRQRFLRRYREHIKKAVEEAVSRRSITDMEHGEQISIPGRDIDEPVLHHGRGGRQTVVHPGNKEFTAGEHIARPSGGGGGRGGGKASNSGEGMDDFVFQITQEEFLDFMFEDLSCPTWSSATSPAPTPSRPSAPASATTATRRASTSSAPCARPMRGASRCPAAAGPSCARR